MIAAHIHNSRCRWIKSLGAPHGVEVPRLVDLRRVRPAQLLKALSRSNDGMVSLIELGIANGGRVPRATWQNFPTDMEHFLSYLPRTRVTTGVSCAWLRANWGNGFREA